jgi:amidase
MLVREAVGAELMSKSDYDVVGKSVASVSADLAAGRVSAVGLVDAYLARIEAIDRRGPALHAVIATEPDARAEAAASDERRRRGHALGPLDGVPILIKDNIEVAGPVPTTAGSLALLHNVSGRDAPIVHRLRAAGAVILGKTNLSEWANFRSSQSISGWSAVGGLTHNPYALDRSACGSSSGSGAAVAASMAPAAIGTETDGSVTCPASMTGLVGLKPTVGLASRTGIVPISRSQDTPGPMTRTVADAALLMSFIAGSDPADAATAAADTHRPGLDEPLDPNALRGARVGVLRFLTGNHAATDRLFETALGVLREAGATLVDVTTGPDLDAVGAAETTVLLAEFKDGLDAYLAASPAGVTARSLADVIAFNERETGRELGLFGQDLMVKAEATAGLDDPGYKAARATALRLAGAEGIDRLLAQERLDVLVAPTGTPAWTIDLVDGDHSTAAASTLPAVAGTPHLTVPMGLVSGLPVGISFIGTAWSDARVLAFGAAFERLAGVSVAPEFLASAPRSARVEGLLVPIR